jgi:hypothetical protein
LYRGGGGRGSRQFFQRHHVGVSQRRRLAGFDFSVADRNCRHNRRGSHFERCAERDYNGQSSLIWPNAQSIHKKSDNKIDAQSLPVRKME